MVQHFLYCVCPFTIYTAHCLRLYCSARYAPTCTGIAANVGMHKLFDTLTIEGVLKTNYQECAKLLTGARYVQHGSCVDLSPLPVYFIVVEMAGSK